MPPGTTAQAQEFVAQVLTACHMFPDSMIGRSSDEKITFLIDAGFLDEMPPPEVRREASLIFRRMRREGDS